MQVKVIPQRNPNVSQHLNIREPNLPNNSQFVTNLIKKIFWERTSEVSRPFGTTSE